MYVTPRAGLRVVDPDLRDFLPAEGREVPESEYWHRRDRDGDVTVGAPPATTPAVAVEEEV